MMDWDKKTNEEINIAISEMVANHDSLRLKLLNGLDVMTGIEKECINAINVLKERGVLWLHLNLIVAVAVSLIH